MGLGLQAGNNIVPQSQNEPACSLKRKSSEPKKINREYCIDQLDLPWGMSAYEQRQLEHILPLLLQDHPLAALPKMDAALLQLAQHIVEQIRSQSS